MSQVIEELKSISAYLPHRHPHTLFFRYKSVHGYLKDNDVFIAVRFATYTYGIVRDSNVKHDLLELGQKLAEQVSATPQADGSMTYHCYIPFSRFIKFLPQSALARCLTSSAGRIRRRARKELARRWKRCSFGATKHCE